MEEREAKILALEEENGILKELVAALTAKITELEARLSKSSKNSNKPPSSDGLKKGTVKNSRIPSGRANGGQTRHAGTTKALNPAPDTIVVLNPRTERECGGEVIIQTDGITVRQVTDIQLAKVITAEYRSNEGICIQCGKLYKASFPSGMKGVASYGDNLQAIVTYLTAYQLIPL